MWVGKPFPENLKLNPLILQFYSMFCKSSSLFATCQVSGNLEFLVRPYLWNHLDIPEPFVCNVKDILKKSSSQRDSCHDFPRFFWRKMILKPWCEESFTALVRDKGSLNTLQKAILIVLVLQMSTLFLYKLGIACLVLTWLVLLRTLVFVLI